MNGITLVKIVSFDRPLADFLANSEAVHVASFSKPSLTLLCKVRNSFGVVDISNRTEEDVGGAAPKRIVNLIKRRQLAGANARRNKLKIIALSNQNIAGMRRVPV